MNAPARRSGIAAVNGKSIGKSTLVGSADVIVGRWIVKGVTCHRQNDREWIGWRAREWFDRDGKRQFADVIGFTDPDIARRMRAAVLEAIKAASGTGQQPAQPALPLDHSREQSGGQPMSAPAGDSAEIVASCPERGRETLP